MNERQRKLLIVIAAREEGEREKLPTMFEISRMAGMNDLVVRDELADMERRKLVTVTPIFRGSVATYEVRLAKNGKKLLPRVREIS